MPRVVHFEIAAEDPKRAAAFYTRVFDWQINQWDGPVLYWLANTGSKDQEGIDGAIMRADESGPTVINWIDVPSIEEFAAKIVEHGGQVLTEKIPVPGVGYSAYCRDTEGNSFGIIQFDRTAK